MKVVNVKLKKIIIYLGFIFIGWVLGIVTLIILSEIASAPYRAYIH